MTNTSPTNAEMYQALVSRDASYEGIFFAAIKTTGIFCRPSCRARKPKVENVEFFRSVKDALLHGYRPCRICNPLENLKRTPPYINTILREISEDVSIKLKDRDLRIRGIEPNKIRRWFLNNHGVTFHAYQRMIRINSAYKKIRNGESVTAAAYTSGYESISGFVESFKSVVGASPKKSAIKRVMNISRIDSPLGPMIAGAVDEGLCLLEFAEDGMTGDILKLLSKRLHAEVIHGPHDIIQTAGNQLEEFFKGTRREFTVPLYTPGTPFQQSVWNELQKVPYGQTISYRQQALAVGKPSAVRAVANANGMNRIVIIIPCHRIIGGDGSLTGYGGGLWRKKWLIDHEQKFTNRK
jgi:AraC family transcriptional regulator, regulatory protein of adaptative response / methylated-DNA-[protein]-cysteine methyltransferase